MASAGSGMLFYAPIRVYFPSISAPTPPAGWIVATSLGANTYSYTFDADKVFTGHIRLGDDGAGNAILKFDGVTYASTLTSGTYINNLNAAEWSVSGASTVVMVTGGTPGLIYGTLYRNP